MVLNTKDAIKLGVLIECDEEKGFENLSNTEFFNTKLDFIRIFYK